MSLKKLKNKTSRNGFDLSKRNIFSAKVGELLPVYCKEVIPGDNFKINVKSFTRTMPVNTAAYTRIKEYYDWFFVPTNLLWNKFNTFVTQMTDNNQHAINIKEVDNVTEQHPFFTLEQIVNYLRQINNDSSSLNYFGYKRSVLSTKLLDYLGYSDMSKAVEGAHLGFSDIYANNPALNPFPLLAYQKIYADFFRDSQWEKAHAPSFNVDYLVGPNMNIPVSEIFSGDTSVENMFDLRYTNWNKDLFMGVKPNSQFGHAASVHILGANLTDNDITPNPVGRASIVKYNSTGFEAPESNIANVRSSGGNSPFIYADGIDYSIFSLTDSALKNIQSYIGSHFPILALRQAEALQKWKEITQSQQQDYKAQIEAHFGVSLSDAYSERCHYIDGFSDVIDINEVVNTNLVQDGNQLNAADIAGKGVGVNDGYTSFSSDVHGYLMCIYHAVPFLDYSLTTRLPRQSLKTNVVDYAIPELDKTGMVSVPLIEMTNDAELNFGNGSDLLGYAPRYYDYKTDVDEIHGSARNRNSAWVAPFDDVYLKQLFGFGDTIIPASPRPITYDFFKVNPSILDPIFVASAQADSTTESDQLLTNCYFDVKCVRNLDYDGLPY